MFEKGERERVSFDDRGKKKALELEKSATTTDDDGGGDDA